MKKRTKEGVRVTVGCLVDSSVAKWLDDQVGYGGKSNVTSNALDFYYDYHFNRKGFFIRLIQEHFQEIKHLLRKVGRAMQFE